MDPRLTKVGAQVGVQVGGRPSYSWARRFFFLSLDGASGSAAAASESERGTPGTCGPCSDVEAPPLVFFLPAATERSEAGGRVPGPSKFGVGVGVRVEAAALSRRCLSFRRGCNGWASESESGDVNREEDAANVTGW
mmetsp:Transcript_1449/g.2734  ORF Transcript_1449/g.2734 Transcript_1449/m.2734 type:complete len:137 (-) Transcript_1449:908-1318(-)